MAPTPTPPPARQDPTDSSESPKPKPSPTPRPPASGATTSTPSTPTQVNASAPLELYVAIRRGRVAILTAFTVSVLLLTVFTFRHGVELTRIKSTDKTPDQQTKLLDDYNSYSGNIASLFGTPVEMFVSAAVQVILLRFMTRSIMQSTPTWKLNAVSVGAGAVAAYLISNGFNAMNVQLQPREVDAVISAEDMSAAFNQSAPGLTTNATHSFSETQQRNPITNTILRNAVLPWVSNQQLYCRDASFDVIPDTGVEFGFRQRDWQARLLSEALPAKTLRVDVGRTNSTLQDAAVSADLPMDAPLAADLYLYGMHLLTNTFSMTNSFLNETEIIKRHPELTEEDPLESKPVPKLANISLARIVGLLPSDDHTVGDEKAFFLNRSAAGLRSQVKNSANTSAAQSSMTYSHIQISDTIAFDALTIEFEIDPMLMAHSSTKKNATRYHGFISDACGPLPGRCLALKVLYGSSDYQYDPPAQIQAFGQCVNAAGTQEIRAVRFYDKTYPLDLDCPLASNTSLLVFSVGKRLTAESFTPNFEANAVEWNSNKTGLSPSSDHVATNLRKLYTVTIGRLSWQWANLSSGFQASCDDTNSTTPCVGLTLPLLNSSDDSSKQRLVAGADSSPVKTLTPLFRKSPFYVNQRMLQLALVREPPPPRTLVTNTGFDFAGVGNLVSGDVLLPHNIKFRNWTDDSKFGDANYCDGQAEDRTNSTYNNHLYNEHGLQPAYTAAVFFLFENAVVRDVIPLDNNASSITLDFKHNVRHLAVWLSVPDQSAWLTLAGCVLLVVGLAVTIAETATLSKTKSDTLAKITAPHVIARVMLDEGQFPPLLLHRHIIATNQSTAEGGGLHRKLDEFAVATLGLEHDRDHDRLAAVA